MNRYEKSLKNAKILIIGVSYKQDIDDYRESPALRVISILQRYNANVEYYDPWVSEYIYMGEKYFSISEINESILRIYDMVMITAAHSNIDYELVQKNAKVIFDTKNVMKYIKNRDNIEVL
ncbi:UDP-N-acetyl-D-glucosamine 6-dehydrogenase [Lachnospiraceae bacterium]|nr:UDP-N-acetyl-D-glucosamine 6-dehydrogenase [Lachnospiraceae bacterium]